MVLIIYLLSILQVLRAGTVVLAQSGLNSIIAEPGAPRPAAYSLYSYPHNLSAVASARWIWDGPGNTADCNMNITVKEDFTVKCLNEPMKVYIAADNYYTSQILGVVGAGNNWASSEVYNVPTVGIACGTNITLTMKAYNLPMSGKVNCSGNPGALIYAVTTNDCPCSAGTLYNPISCLCETCATLMQGCLLCSSLSVCTQCDVGSHFQLSGGQCICQVGYQFAAGGSNCLAVCGDGYVRGVEVCDDGNLLDGDGCDSACRVEANYTCTSPPSTISVCGYSQPLKGQILSTTKDPYKNVVQFTIQFSDINFPGIAFLNFSQLLTPNLPIGNSTFAFSSSGLLTIRYNLQGSIEGSNLTLSLQPQQLNPTLYWAVPPSTVQLNSITSPNNCPLTFYNSTIYQTQEILSTILSSSEIVSYLVLLLGLLCDKVIGVELFGVWQTIFFSLANIDKVQPLLYPVLTLKSVNGVNSLVHFSNQQLPERVRAIDYSAEFISNCSYTAWTIPALLILGTITLLVGKLMRSAGGDRVREWGRRLLHEYFLMAVSFNALNICYSSGLQFAYKSTQMVEANLAMSGGFLGLIAAAALLVLLSPNPQAFGEFKLHFKQGIVQKNYFVVSLLYRSILGFLLGAFNEADQTTVVAFFLGVVYFVYLIGDIPYKFGYHNWRSSFVQLCCVIGLGCSMYYRSMRSNSQIADRTSVLEPAFLLVAALLSSILVSLLALCYELYLKYSRCRCCRSSYQVAEDHKPIVTLPTLGDDIGAQDKNSTVFSLEKEGMEECTKKQVNPAVLRLECAVQPLF